MEELGMEVGLAGLKRRGFEPGVIFDVGAAAGDWARMALGLWPRALVYCFEPLQERWAQIEALARDFQGQVQLLPIGLGDTDAKLSMGVTEFLWDSSFSYGGATARQIDVHRLDTLLEEGRIVAPSLVKLDVQGFERKVLTGGERALAQTDAIIVECSFFSFCDDMTTLDESIAFMAARNFQPYEFLDFLRRPLDGAMGQCDILFVRRTHPMVADKRWAEP